MLNWCIVTLLYNYNLAKDTPSLIQLKLFLWNVRKKIVYYSMQASVCVWRVQPGYLLLIQVWKVVWVCNGCSRGISPSPKYARFRESVKGAAGVSPPHLIMQGLVSMHWMQLGCLPLTWVCMISVGKKRNRERLVQLGYLPLTSACAVCQYRLYESIHQSSCYH